MASPHRLASLATTLKKIGKAKPTKELVKHTGTIADAHGRVKKLAERREEKRGQFGEYQNRLHRAKARLRRVARTAARKTSSPVRGRGYYGNR